MDNLLARARDGDKSAEEEIFQHLLVRFRLFSRHKIGDHDIADEIAQKACLTILKKYKTAKYTIGFEAWAYGVLKMTIKNHFSSLKTNQNMSLTDMGGGEETIPAAASTKPELERRLTDCLRRLFKINRRYARVLNLSYQGYETDEICRKLDINRNNLYVTLNRARTILWACLRNKME